MTVEEIKSFANNIKVDYNSESNILLTNNNQK